MPTWRRHLVFTVILAGLASVAVAGCLAVPVPVPGPGRAYGYRPPRPAIIVPAPSYGGYYRGYHHGYPRGHHRHY